MCYVSDAASNTFSGFTVDSRACPTNPLGRGSYNLVEWAKRRVPEFLTAAWNLLLCDGEQGYLTPPSLREWLVEGDLARFIVDAVEQVELRGLSYLGRT